MGRGVGWFVGWFVLGIGHFLQIVFTKYNRKNTGFFDTNPP